MRVHSRLSWRWLLPGLCLLTACGKQEDGTEKRTAFDLRTHVAATRAPVLESDGSGEFSRGDRLSLFFTGSGETLRQPYIYGNTYYWEDMDLPAGSASIAVSGCYPQVEPETLSAFRWNIQEQSAAPDLLIAPAVEATVDSPQPIVMPFRHALHKLSVVLTADGTTVQQQELEEAQVTLRQVSPVTTVDLVRGVVKEASGTKTDLSGEGAAVGFMIPAQEAEGISLTVRVGDREKTLVLTDYTADGKPVDRLEDGKSLQVSLRVSRSGIVLGDMTIGGWESQGSIDGSIEI